MINHEENIIPMKFKFELNIWLSFTYNGEYCIGRTLLIDEDTRIIAAVSESGKTGHISFDEIEKPKKINFLNNGIKIKENNDFPIFTNILGKKSGLN